MPNDPRFDLSGKVAVITGATRGIGRAIAFQLGRAGAAVVVSSRKADAVNATVQALEAEGVDARGFPANVGRLEEARALIGFASSELGGLDVLVNNASELGGIGPLMQFDVQRFGRVFPVNAGAPVALVQLAVPLLAERRGLIVNITSDAAQAAYPGWGPYGASKAALELLTRTLALELRDRGVSAVIVDPGDMRTRMHQEAFPLDDISDRPLPEVTVPFWNWLFDQTPAQISGERFAAQAEDARWLQQA